MGGYTGTGMITLSLNLNKEGGVDEHRDLIKFLQNPYEWCKRAKMSQYSLICTITKCFLLVYGGKVMYVTLS